MPSPVPAQNKGCRWIASSKPCRARSMKSGALRAGALLAATALMLGGCASLTPAPHQASTAPEQILRGNIDYHGRFAVHYVDNNGEDRNVYGNFDLQQQADSTTLQLLNPLGQTMARISVSPLGATLELPGHPVQTASAVETLMQHAIGFPLPMSGLRYWLKPEAAPDTPAQITKDPSNGRISQIRQDDWVIDYLAYNDPVAAASPDQTGKPTAPGDLQPTLKRVNLNRAAPPLDVKLVIDR